MHFNGPRFACCAGAHTAAADRPRRFETAGNKPIRLLAPLRLVLEVRPDVGSVAGNESRLSSFARRVSGPGPGRERRSALQGVSRNSRN